MCPARSPALPSVSPTTACATLVPSSYSTLGCSSQLSILMVVSILPVMLRTLYVTGSHVLTPAGGAPVLSPHRALWRGRRVCFIGGDAVGTSRSALGPE